MKTSKCLLSFVVFSGFLFKITSPKCTTVSPQDGDRVSYQQRGGTYPLQSVCEQTYSSSLGNNALIQPRIRNWKTESPKAMEASGIANSMKSKIISIGNSKKNLTRNIRYSRKNLTWNVLRHQRITEMPQGRNSSLTGLAKKRIVSSKYNPKWKPLIPQDILRSKRELAEYSSRRIDNLFRVQRSKETFRADKSMEALMRKIIVDHMNGCDLIVIYDQIYQETRTLETLVSFPVIKQVLQLVSLENLSDMIVWESQNCQGTIFLMSDPDILIKFGRTDGFLWAYQAKVIIMGLKLHSLETFLKTVKGRKTEHVIGVVEDPINHHLEVYMNLLFWGKGMQLMTGWSGNKFTRKADLFPDKMKDFRKGEVRVTIFENRPLTFYEYGPNQTVIARNGEGLTVIRTLAEKFNFTLNFIEVEAEYGVPLGNGSFSGLVGYMQRDVGHFGIPYIYHSGLNDRQKVQDYSRFIVDDKSCFLFRIEAPRPAWQSLGLPFTPQSWIAVISGIILSGPLFYLLVIASTTAGEEYDNFKSLSYSSLFTIGIQIDSPLVAMPQRMCNQIFIVFLLVYSLILTTGYRSNLISFLTVARPPHQINTFKDLAESRLPVHGYAWFYNAMEASGDPYLKEVMERYKVKFFMDEYMDDFMKGKVLTLNSIYLLEGLRTLMKTKTGKPLTRYLKKCLSSHTIVIGFQKHTPLKRTFDKAISSLVESGIRKKFALDTNQQFKKLVEREGGNTHYPDIWDQDKDGLIPLSNSHMTGIWGAVVIGYSLATISLAVEVISQKRLRD